RRAPPPSAAWQVSAAQAPPGYAADGATRPGPGPATPRAARHGGRPGLKCGGGFALAAQHPSAWAAPEPASCPTGPSSGVSGCASAFAFETALRQCAMQPANASSYQEL